MHLSKSVATSGLVMVLCLAGILTAGCSTTTTSPTTSTTTSTSTSTSTSTTTTLPPTTSTPTSSTTTTTEAGPAAVCSPNQVKVVALQGSGAAGTIYSPIGLENTSTTACSLDGRPEVSLIGSMQGAKAGPLSTTVQTTGSESVFSIAASSVTLPPGGAASAGFLVQSSDVPTDGEQTCPVVGSLSIGLPGVSATFSVAETFTACGGPTISVSAIVKASALQQD
jgi:hypothetical protein